MFIVSMLTLGHLSGAPLVEHQTYSLYAARAAQKSFR